MLAVVVELVVVVNIPKIWSMGDPQSRIAL